MFCCKSSKLNRFRAVLCTPRHNNRGQLNNNLSDVAEGWTLRQHLSHFFSRAGQNEKEEPAKAKPPQFKCILSGIQPTGVPHLGNYFGAIRHWVELQESGRYDRVLLSVVDLHSLTVPPHKPAELRKNTLDMIACLIACGIDPERSILFKQSAISEHAELAWILGCLTTMNHLNHLPAWQEKSVKMHEVPLGLYTYPVLQAADILIYKATHVPVGDDQIKHIELCRDLARLFNRQFKDTFPIPYPIVTEFKRIRSLRDPTSKMSKSDVNPKSRIDLLDSPDEIRNKIKKAMTDSKSILTYDPVDRPGVSNLIEIHAAFTDRFPEEFEIELLLENKVSYKEKLAEIVIEKLTPIQKEVARLQSDPEYLNSVIDLGNMKAKEIAHQNLVQIKEAVGLS